MNPNDLLGFLHPHGALPSPTDTRDHQWKEVAFGSAPFDWSVGYDVEHELSAVLNTVDFKLPVKNQGQSGSCGGQAEASLGEVKAAFQRASFVEKSAKFPYAQVFAQGGGSADRDLSDVAIKQGWAHEPLCPSYKNGQPPSEMFMERPQDITQAARDSAAIDHAVSYANVDIDIDTIAQAIRDSKGVRLGIVGANNGTYLNAHPVAPKDGDVFWYHWVAAFKARLYNGEKEIGFLNSWGTNCGEKGWQWLNQDHFTRILTTSPHGRVVWAARTTLYNPVVLPTSFHHTFAQQLDFGASGPEVQALQTVLQMDGEFPTNVKTTQYFGNLTRTALQKFQARYGIAAGGTPYTTGYGRVGPRTIMQLNKLFA